MIILIGLLLTFITGLFFLLGVLLNKWCKNKEQVSVFAIGLAFIVLLNLICFDILPETFEHFSYWNIVYIIIGLLLLKVIDLFVPHHEHNHQEKNDNKKEHVNHLEHISIITVLALTLHNIIECMALYNVTLTSVKSGILMCLAIGLHNVPLGFQVGSNLNKNKITYMLILVLSGLLGGVVCLLIGALSDIWINFILCFTLGMLIYLTFFELLKELWESRKNKYALWGITLGLIFICLSRLI